MISKWRNEDKEREMTSPQGPARFIWQKWAWEVGPNHFDQINKQGWKNKWRTKIGLH